jgi:hypothetical protein
MLGLFPAELVEAPEHGANTFKRRRVFQDRRGPRRGRQGSGILPASSKKHVVLLGSTRKSRRGLYSMRSAIFRIETF